MKSLSLLLSGMVLVVGTQSHAQVNLRRGGNHDGGGQGVLLKDGSVALADRFQPVAGSDEFLSKDLAPVDPFALFPGLEAEVRKLSNLLDVYAGLPDFGQRKQTGLLMNLLKSEKSQFYLVPQLPNVSDCGIPRDNSGVPNGAVVAHAACTRDKVTLLLNAGPLAFASLPRKLQADLLAHEALRHMNTVMATASIETIVNGLAQARDIADRQQAGDRQNLSERELSILMSMMQEFPRTVLTGTNGALQLTAMGGGLVSPDSGLAPGAFVGIGSRIFEGILVNAGAEIINSSIWSRAARLVGSVGARTRIINSSVLTESIELGPEALIENSIITSKKLRSSYFLVIKDSVLYGGGMVFGNRASVLNSKVSITRSPGLAIDISFGEGSLIKDSTLAEAGLFVARPKLENPKPWVFLATDSQLLNSSIRYTRSYTQGANATVRDLNMTVHSVSFPVGQFSAQTDIVIDPGSEIKGGALPVIMLGEDSYFFASKLTLTGKMTVGQSARACKMGFDPKTDTIYGVLFGKLVVSSDDQLAACGQTEKLTERWCEQSSFECNDGEFFEAWPQRLQE